MNELRKKTFKNGVVYCLQLEDGFLVETTDTFLPYYTKDAIGRHQNKLDNNELGDRTERWMIGVSTMSGCPVRCKFCATGNMKRYRNLTADEIVAQVEFAISHAGGADPAKAKEFKINYTRMGEPFLNIEAVKEAIRIKTEPKYRPFENKEECWQEMLKHQPFGWTKSISEKRFYFISKIDDNGCFFSNNDDVSFKTLFASDKFADGTPFGIKVE